MIKLELPNIDVGDLYSECVDGIGSEVLQARYIAEQNLIEDAATLYREKAVEELLCDLPSVARNQNPCIAGDLTKSDLVKLYSQYMVPSTKPARHFYDEIFVAANGSCPFCGGIGATRNLDHFLPKTNFPLYSITPDNLVPSCRDCNTEKNNAFATIPEGQSIHPYLDNDRYFLERWVTASIRRTDPVSIQFEVTPPEEWDECHKHRVATHFQDFGLAGRYGKVAGSELSTIVDWRRGILRACSDDAFRSQLAETGQDTKYLLNGWKRTMYVALSQNDWFCSNAF